MHARPLSLCLCRRKTRERTAISVAHEPVEVAQDRTSRLLVAQLLLVVANADGPLPLGVHGDGEEELLLEIPSVLLAVQPLFKVVALERVGGRLEGALLGHELHADGPRRVERAPVVLHRVGQLVD